MLNIRKLEPFKDVWVLEETIFRDERGFFQEILNIDRLHNDMDIASIFNTVREINLSKSHLNVFRGLHFQRKPYAQAKIITVTNGMIEDYMVDIRRNSPTFGMAGQITLSPPAPYSNMMRSVIIPRGYAHGFISRAPNTEVLYKVDNEYKPSHAMTLNYRPFINPESLLLDDRIMIISDKDRLGVSLEEAATMYEG